MTGDIAEHYLFLQEDAARITSTNFLTRPLGVHVRAGEVLAGLDVNGLRHLLIPVQRDDQIHEDQQSSGVAIIERHFGSRDATARFADLVCLDSALELVFERLVEDVVNRLSGAEETPVEVAHRALADWRALLRKADQGITREAAVGLVGELEILRRLSSSQPAAAVSAWRGPQGGLHDFSVHGRAIEVKTTSSVDGNFVQISNLDQLDPASAQRLHLVVVHVRDDPTAPSIDERVQELVELGVPRRQLIDLVADVGYIFESAGNSEHRYGVRSVRVWEVDDAFPGLRRSDLGRERTRGVGRVRYELALDAASPAIGNEVAESMLAAWVVSE